MMRLATCAWVVSFAVAMMSATAIADEAIPPLDLLDLDGYEVGDLGMGSYPDLIAGAGWIPARPLDPLGESGASGRSVSLVGTMQEPPPWPEPQPGAPPPIYTEERMISSDISIGGFVSSIAGVAVDFGADDVEYPDIFDLGTGFSLQWRLHITTSQSFGREISWGPGVFFDWASYNGDRDTDAFGDSLEPDEMNITKLLGGIHFRSVFGGVFYIGGQFGLGLGYIDTVDATLDLSGSGLGIFDIELYEATATFCFDATLRIGAKWDVGPSAAMGFFGSLGYAIMGPPGDGSDVNDLDAGPIGQGYFGMAFCVDFGRQNLGMGPMVP